MDLPKREPGCELLRVKQSLPIGAENILILPLDLEQPNTIPELVQQVITVFYQIDILVHNGGISHRGLVIHTPLLVDQKIMAINYFGAVALTKAVLPVMVQQQSGHLVVISSLVGKFGTPLRSAYAASKHALHGFFDSLRAEIWRDNIGVSIICPGYIRTRISYNALNEKGGKHNQMDQNQEKGIDPVKCAHFIIKAIAAGKQEMVKGGKETMGVYLKRFVPSLFSSIIRRMFKPS